MLPAFLDSTYKRYKHDTSKFIKWLFENGQKCGYKTPVSGAAKPQQEQVPAAKPRLKGKARKEAKQAAKATPSADPNDGRPAAEHRLVPPKELLPLAKAIVNSKMVTIPSDIIRSGLSAISARKRCTNYFKSKTTPEDIKTAQSNSEHSYFISLMEEVIMTLQPCFATSAGASTHKAEAKSVSIEDLENRFASLEVEEPQEDNVPAEPSPSTNSLEVVYDVEPPKTEKDIASEKLFALFCLFDDLQCLRTFIREQWVEFAVGKSSLITVSVVTNAALQLSIRTQDEILAAYPDCADYQSVLEAVMNAYNTNSHEELEAEIDDTLVHWIFAPAHQILDSFCDILRPNQVPFMKRGHFGIYNPSADRRKMTDAQQQNEDTILLCELLPEFAFIQRFKIGLFASDELTRGLVKMIETGKIPIWLTFATTILLDIHHLLRGNVGMAYDQLQVVGKHVKSTLDRHFKFSENLPAPVTWPKGNDKVLRSYAEGVDESILNDVVFPLKVKYYKQFGRVPPGEEERLYLLKRQPMLCGILAFRAALELQSAGVNLCNAWGTITYPAQFYMAVRNQDSSIQSWPGMDKAISIHTEERIFLGAAPKTIQESFKQTALILGYSASNFAPNRRQRGPTAHSKTGPRGLKSTTILGDFFGEGLAEVPGQDRHTFKIHDVEELLNEEAKNAELASDPKNKALRREWATTKRLTSLQLLQALKQFLPIELPKIDFNYFRMHEESIELLRTLRVELDQDFQKYFGPWYLDNESQLPFVGLYVIMTAFQSARVAEHYKIDAAGSLLLEKAGRVFEEFIDELLQD
ncbi:uncharacterized protein PAC_16783 [Phialocephala subalpina]|uniref:DUF6604 domain-containing protein n=1 Tax=Phialocephala subalpina TaxID=576137 RepID=A0A1L7XPE0_9HELO|nr:uncharacterized protein PAC_16783 [Phialocephala subalpina]